MRSGQTEIGWFAKRRKEILQYGWDWKYSKDLSTDLILSYLIIFLSRYIWQFSMCHCNWWLVYALLHPSTFVFTIIVIASCCTQNWNCKTLVCTITVENFSVLHCKYSVRCTIAIGDLFCMHNFNWQLFYALCNAISYYTLF